MYGSKGRQIRARGSVAFEPEVMQNVLMDRCWTEHLTSVQLEADKEGARDKTTLQRGVTVGKKGYGQSMSFLAYFLTMLSSPKMNRDLLTVKQFCRTGIGLYKAIVRALCAFDCL